MKATYTYLADGTKIKTINASGVGYDYIGSFKYNRSNSNITLESVATAGGRTYKTSSGYEARYFISDHLGSTRLVASANGTVSEQNDYMPYGDRHANSALAASTNPYLYNGKESQKDFGINYIDSEARFQRLDGAFNSIDPLSEENYWVSPYTYCRANPIKYIDPNAKKWVDAQNRIIWKNGVWAEFVDPRIKEIGNLLMTTESGKHAFYSVANSPVVMKLIISNEIKLSKYKTLIRGQMLPKTFTKNSDDTYQLIDGEITIFEGSIKEELKTNGNAGIDQTHDLIKELPNNIMLDGAAGSTIIHEIEHGTPQNIKQQFENYKKKTNHI